MKYDQYYLAVNLCFMIFIVWYIKRGFLDKEIKQNMIKRLLNRNKTKGIDKSGSPLQDSNEFKF